MASNSYLKTSELCLGTAKVEALTIDTPAELFMELERLVLKFNWKNKYVQILDTAIFKSDKELVGVQSRESERKSGTKYYHVMHVYHEQAMIL